MIIRQLRKCVKAFASSNNSGPRRGCVALGQEFVEGRGKKKSGRIEFSNADKGLRERRSPRSRHRSSRAGDAGGKARWKFSVEEPRGEEEKRAHELPCDRILT